MARGHDLRLEVRAVREGTICSVVVIPVRTLDIRADPPDTFQVRFASPFQSGPIETQVVPKVTVPAYCIAAGPLRRVDAFDVCSCSTSFYVACLWIFFCCFSALAGRFADVSGLKEWKGLTWGMLPLHTSGLIACTYHIFYNSPELISLVAMQVSFFFLFLTRPRTVSAN